MAEKASGLSRRELFIDARDLQSDSDPDNPLTADEYTAALTARGMEKLAENQLVRSFSADVRTYDPTYPYGEDFLLGDAITITDEQMHITIRAIVYSAERSVSAEGESLTLTFGYGQPSIYDVLKQKAGK